MNEINKPIVRISEVGLIAAISAVIGVFIGSRSGGTYFFEIGENLFLILFWISTLFFIWGLLYLVLLMKKQGGS
ncbi:MAG: hypothetical protein ACFE9L_12555 [Candidatus Hodarchaeota archaeon]